MMNVAFVKLVHIHMPLLIPLSENRDYFMNPRIIGVPLYIITQQFIRSFRAIRTKLIQKPLGYLNKIYSNVYNGNELPGFEINSHFYSFFLFLYVAL